MNRLEQFTPSPPVAYALLVVAAFLWAASTVVSRGYHEIIPPMGMTFGRVLTGVVVLLPIALPELRRSWPLIRAHLPMLAFLGVMQVAPQALLVVAVNFTTAINATLANASQPAITAILALVLIRNRISGLQTIGIVLALLGVGIMVVRADLQVLMNFDFNIGDFIVIIAVVGWGIYAIYIPRLPREIGLSTVLFIVMASGIIPVIPAFIIEGIYFRPTPATLEVFSVLIALGFFITVLSIYLWNAGLRVVGAIRATIFINLIPVFGALLAIIFLGEQLFAYHLAGAVFVCAGISMVILLAPKKSGSDG